MSNALRPFALGAALVACCLLTWPASAQFHNTRLSDKGRALEKTTRARVEACRVVYQWDRCHGRRNIMDDIADLHSNRRQRCIMSSRNVAAEKGATAA